MLSPEELSRYSRNILLNEVKRSGQERLKNSIVTIVGAGGLGSPALLYLAAAGVGKIRVIDSDTVDTTNLQRQIIYKHSDIGQPKAIAAAKNASSLNPYISVEGIQARISRENASDLLKGSDLVLEGSDNFETKFLINDICIQEKIPYITAGVLRFEGMVMGIRPGEDACFRCIYEESPAPEHVPSCADAGVIGSMAGMIGTIQATESIQFLLNTEDSRSGLFGKILQVDSKSMEFRTIPICKREDCEACSLLIAKKLTV
ncbi:HesA/MoeB/ThiF family protein [Leptospira semungkisensis]|uniref:Molybdopterin-synthase adenylyltransferase n=1 Tax=Leptospira semungkisensis TaxID=2484985 RepID=A0A4R9G9D2_9LEPT|nr:HesA/MoeB/ThiF family protein [Leptospira semungkisensis]TGK07497.1 HesA/MoeB/ThiF family protein [Leptospira semungkisensis]